jgi:hypothetical protein
VTPQAGQPADPTRRIRPTPYVPGYPGLSAPAPPPAPARPDRGPWVLLAAAVVFAAGGLWAIYDQDVLRAPVANAATTTPVPACEKLFPADGPITADRRDTTCAGAAGTRWVAAVTCVDGRTLLQVMPEGRTDAVGWGFAGESYQTVVGPPLDDPGYRKSFVDCYRGRGQSPHIRAS